MIKSSDNLLWTTRLTDFYRFIEESHNFIKTKISPAQNDLELIVQIKGIMEINKVNSNGNRYKDIKFDSAIYRDIEQIVLMKSFLKSYTTADLKHFQKLIVIEITGLEGDMRPRTILTSTIPAAIITGISLAAVWSALGASYFGIDLSNIVAEVFISKLAKISWLRGILSVVFVIGGFLGITWYVTGSYRNQKQILYLKSLSRAISLFFAIENDSEEN
jgi:hypothetical protein